jgi:hypothetical protein
VKTILVGRDSAVTGQWRLSPLQSVIDPPAPSMTGTRERKSYGCTKPPTKSVIVVKNSFIQAVNACYIDCSYSIKYDHSFFFSLRLY